MSQEWPYRFNFSIPPKGKEISVEEAERMLLKKLEDCENEPENALWDLVVFYSVTDRQMMAFSYVERLLAMTDDLEKKAVYYLTLGQLMEQTQDYESAISFYTRAFSLEPVISNTWYLINNNLGYCLNHFGRYQQAEPYCRAAIKIDPLRHNAYKNLGISLEGQGQFTEAARCFIQAVKANAADPRACHHLEDLITKHPEISEEMPDISEQVDGCQKAVQMVMEIMRKSMEEGEEEIG